MSQTETLDSGLSPVPPHVPDELVFDYDYLSAPDNNGDLTAHWQRLHDLGQRVIYTPRNGGHWIVGRHEDVGHVLSAYEDFSSIHQTIPISTALRLPPSEYDPPDHHEFRKLISPFFSPKSIADLEIQARQLRSI